MRDMFMGLLFATTLFILLPNPWTLAFVCMMGFVIYERWINRYRWRH